MPAVGLTDGDLSGDGKDAWAPGTDVGCRMRRAQRVRSGEGGLETGSGGQCLPKRSRMEEGRGASGTARWSEHRSARGQEGVHSGGCGAGAVNEWGWTSEDRPLSGGSAVPVLEMLAAPCEGEQASLHREGPQPSSPAASLQFGSSRDEKQGSVSDTTPLDDRGPGPPGCAAPHRGSQLAARPHRVLLPARELGDPRRSFTQRSGLGGATPPSPPLVATETSALRGGGHRRGAETGGKGRWPTSPERGVAGVNQRPAQEGFHFLPTHEGEDGQGDRAGLSVSYGGLRTWHFVPKTLGTGGEALAGQ